MTRTNRNIRVEDELWEAALAKAAAEDRPLSQIVRELLRQWVATKPNRKGLI
jgi:hypothetical protein